jgi:hypothetical protein
VIFLTLSLEIEISSYVSIKIYLSFNRKIMLSSLKMWSIFLILSNDVLYFDYAMMEKQSFEIYHFYGLQSCTIL